MVKMYCNQLEQRILYFLRRRGGVPISSPELGAVFGVGDRKIRAIVRHLRKDHDEPICATSSDGFFWPRGMEHADHTIAQLHSREMEIRETREGIERGLQRYFGQQSFELEEAG